LVLAAHGAATELGLAQALTEEWAMSQPDLEERFRAARASAEAKGWRWEDEMREIARTFRDVGQPGEFGQAAAEVFKRHERPGLRA
jgi:uncharacterized protein DUF1932